MREVISLHIGQTGCQIGQACWELFALEHGIKPDGSLKANNKDNGDSSSYFAETEEGKIVPRNLFIDSDSSAIDLIRKGEFRGFYDENSMIYGKEDAANNFARGLDKGKDCIDGIMDRISYLTENCDSLSGFLIYNALGGGTGSGFTSLIAEKLSNEYSGKSKLQFGIFPASGVSASVVEPYNTLLTMHNTRYDIDGTFLMDNDALFDILYQKLRVSRPTYKNLNRLIAQIVSSVTASRFPGPFPVSLNDIQTNLFPFPAVKFPIASYAPLSAHQNFRNCFTNTSLTNSALDNGNLFIKTDLTQGSIIGTCLMYRGDVQLKDTNLLISKLMNAKSIKSVEWATMGRKLGVTSKAPSFFPDDDLVKTKKSVCLLANTTAIVENFTRLGKRFDSMYKYFAFAHWYLNEGMELERFNEARQSLAELEENYLALEEGQNEEGEEDEEEDLSGFYDE